MSELASTKPYIVRALHEWCMDNGLTPHLLVRVNPQTRVPMGYVKDGEIVLNLNYAATKDLLIANDAISFSARFGGVSQNLYIPIDAVRGIFARENGQGMFFQEEAAEDSQPDDAKPSAEASDVESKSQKKLSADKKPSLKLVK